MDVLADIITVDTGPDGSILLHVPTSRYLQLDKRATEIVELLGAHGDATRAARALAERTGLSLEQAASDVSTVLDSFGEIRDRKAGPARRISAGGVVAVARNWLRLPASELLGTAMAAGLLCLVEIGFRVTDIRRLASWLRVPLSADEGAPAPNGDPAELSPRNRRWISRIEWVLARWIYPPTCLRRALLTGYFLRSGRPVLRLGLMADGQTAHAWVEVEGRSYWVTEGLTPFARPRHHGG